MSPKRLRPDQAIKRDFEVTCGHCGGAFVDQLTYRQRWRQQRGESTPYCSPACSGAARTQKAQAQALREGKTLRKGALTGPCKQCGAMFVSRVDKLYCSMGCYTSSPQFLALLAKNRDLSPEARARRASAQRTGEEVPCMECGAAIYLQKSKAGARKFCGKVCYRSYYAKRFDRWVASPEGMALPQCYDEFLDREALRCVVEGCDWEGLHLTSHMNHFHGLPASDFKRATGFNLNTGVIAMPLAKKFQLRQVRGVALSNPGAFQAKAHAVQNNGAYVRYRSLEACEHMKKARAMMGTGPTRICKWCASEFAQSTPMGRALYCTVKCRASDYAKMAREKRAAAKGQTLP